MKQEHKSYDEDFKKTIVNLYESGKRKADLTREYGIGISKLPIISIYIPKNNIHLNLFL